LRGGFSFEQVVSGWGFIATPTPRSGKAWWFGQSKYGHPFRRNCAHSHASAGPKFLAAVIYQTDHFQARRHGWLKG